MHVINVNLTKIARSKIAETEIAKTELMYSDIGLLLHLNRTKIQQIIIMIPKLSITMHPDIGLLMHIITLIEP